MVVNTSLLLLFLQLMVITVPEVNAAAESRHPLLVLMLDGFKWDYLDLIPDNLGGFSEFVKGGVRAEHVNGIYPTLSYPSWTTLSTGLYAENHGILGNYFYNRAEKTTFQLHAPNNQLFWWNTAEPVWTTAKKEGLRVGTILWSRSDVPVDGILPDEASGYKVAGNWTVIENTLEKSLEYIQNGFHLVMAYGEHIDNVGHKYGPKSTEVREALVDVGQVLERFFGKLSNMGLRDKVNVLIVSDHGMTDASIEAKTRSHRLEVYINSSHVECVMDQGALAMIYTKPGYTEQVYNDLQAMEGVRVYEKRQIPEYYHFAKNVNAPDILLVAQQGNVMIGIDNPQQIPEAWIMRTIQGVHGYDPREVSDMRTIFMATGPDFKKGLVKPSIDLKDIYQIFCHVLGISPSPHNGTWSTVKDFFVVQSDTAYSAARKDQSTFFLTISFLSILFKYIF